MDNLAYLHLALAAQEAQSQEKPKPDNLGASWDKAAWNQIFEKPKPTPDTKQQNRG